MIIAVCLERLENEIVMPQERDKKNQFIELECARAKLVARSLKAVEIYLITQQPLLERSDFNLPAHHVCVSLYIIYTQDYVIVFLR